MPSGVQTFDAAGAMLLNSPEMTGIFYNNAGVYNGTASLPVTGFDIVSAVSTPVQTPSYYWNGNSGVYSAAVSATGSIGYQQVPGANQYLAPVTIENSGVNCFIVTPTLYNISTQIYNFGTPTGPLPPNDYGMKAPGKNVAYNFSELTTVSIDSRYKSYYLQPGPDGQPLRNATCTSIPSSYNTSIDTYIFPTGALTGQTIYFEKAYVNPPLIFLTYASGPISFHYMHKNDAGLYDGMVIVAASSPSTQGLAGTSYYTPNTYAFTYYMISDEKPLYKAESAYGMQINNANGQEIFNSSYFVSNFRTQISRQPYFKLLSFYRTPSCTNVGSGAYEEWDTNKYYVDPPNGICINNINSIKGHTTYSSINPGSGSASSGPTTFWGHYIDLQYDSLLGHNVATIRATGTNGIFMSPTFQTPGVGNSWEYFDHTKNVYLLFGNYAY